MIKNKKGQALVEFVLILPILILILLAIIDIGVIFIKKSELENTTTDIIEIWKQENSSIENLEQLLVKEGLETNIIKNTTTTFITIKIKQKISLAIPMKQKYTIQIKRVIPLE